MKNSRFYLNPSMLPKFVIKNIVKIFIICHLSLEIFQLFCCKKRYKNVMFDLNIKFSQKSYLNSLTSSKQPQVQLKKPLSQKVYLVHLEEIRKCYIQHIGTNSFRHPCMHQYRESLQQFPMTLCQMLPPLYKIRACTKEPEIGRKFTIKSCNTAYKFSHKHNSFPK